MATTRIMPLHVGKGRTESRAISDIMENAVFCIRGSAQRCKWTDTAWKVKKIC